MSQGPSGSPFPPPDLDPLLSQADEAEAAAPEAPARAGRPAGFSRRGLVGALLAVAVVSTATLATTAVLVTGKDSSPNGIASNRAAIAPRHVADVSVTAHRVAGTSSRSLLTIDISVASAGSSVFTLLGGARFRDGGSTQSVQLHAGPNRVRVPLSAETPPGRYSVKIFLETTAGRSIAIERPFDVSAG
jgi:hypothetical protein